MTFASYVGKKDNAKTIFVSGVFAVLSVNGLSNEQKVKFIEKEMDKLDTELAIIEVEYELACETEDIKDPFVDLGVK
jgi:hypothetical protein